MEEHRQRVSAATSAATLGDLQTLVDDLQTEHAPVRLPELKEPSRVQQAASSAKRGWGFTAAITAVLVVLGIAIGWGSYGNSSSPFDFTTDPGAKPDGVVPIVNTPPVELQSLGGLSGFFEQMRKKFGDTMGYSVTINPDDAYLSRADPTDDRAYLNFRYHGGFGSGTSNTRNSSQTHLVDLANFDYAAIIGTMKGAPQILRMREQEIEDVTISVGPSTDATTPDAVVVDIRIDGEHDDGTLKLAADGTCMECAPIKYDEP